MKVGRFGLGFKSVFHITGRRNLKKTDIIKDLGMVVKSLKLIIACSRHFTLESVMGIFHFCKRKFKCCIQKNKSAGNRKVAKTDCEYEK